MGVGVWEGLGGAKDNQCRIQRGGEKVATSERHSIWVLGKGAEEPSTSVSKFPLDMQCLLSHGPKCLE